MPNRCPICGQSFDPALTEARYRPFCSRRCADVDLGRWLGEAYRIPTANEEPAPLDREDEAG